MKHFAIATTAAKPKTELTPKIAMIYAGVLVLMALSQLFSFEKFITLVQGFWLPGGEGTGSLVASLIVISEVFALPFLLRMRLSPLMRIVSMVAGWLVPLLWLAIVIWLNVTTNAVMNIGLLGASVSLPVGWWALGVALNLAIGAAWASWGMWPVARMVQHRKAK